MGKKETIIPFCYRKGQSGNPAGRPKSRVRAFLKELAAQEGAVLTPLRRFEVDEIYAALLTMDETTLVTVAKSKEAPALMRAYARAILVQLQAGRTDAVEKARENAFGKIVQPLDIKQETTAAVARMTPEQLRERLGRLRRVQDMEKDKRLNNLVDGDE